MQLVMPPFTTKTRAIWTASDIEVLKQWMKTSDYDSKRTAWETFQDWFWSLLPQPITYYARALKILLPPNSRTILSLIKQQEKLSDFPTTQIAGKQHREIELLNRSTINNWIKTHWQPATIDFSRETSVPKSAIPLTIFRISLASLGIYGISVQRLPWPWLRLLSVDLPSADSPNNYNVFSSDQGSLKKIW